MYTFVITYLLLLCYLNKYLLSIAYMLNLQKYQYIEHVAPDNDNEFMVHGIFVYITMCTIKYIY